MDKKEQLIQDALESIRLIIWYTGPHWTQDDIGKVESILRWLVAEIEKIE